MEVRAIPPSIRHKTRKRPPGWVEAGEKAGGREKGKLGGEEWLVGRIKAMETFKGT